MGSATGDGSPVRCQVDWMGLFEDLMGTDIVSGQTLVEIPGDGYVQKLSKLIEKGPKR